MCDLVTPGGERADCIRITRFHPAINSQQNAAHGHASRQQGLRERVDARLASVWSIIWIAAGRCDHLLAACCRHLPAGRSHAR